MKLLLFNIMSTNLSSLYIKESGVSLWLDYFTLPTHEISRKPLLMRYLENPYPINQFEGNMNIILSST